MTSRFKIYDGTTEVKIESGSQPENGSISPFEFTGYEGQPQFIKISGAGDLVVGKESSNKPLHVAYRPLDFPITQPMYNDTISDTDTYQSFTATYSGILVAFLLRATTSPYTGTLEVRKGTGTSGALLSSTSISLPVDINTLVYINPCYLEASEVYSFVITGISNMKASNSNMYAGGTSNIPGWDLTFTVYMKNDTTTPTDLFTADGTSIDFEGTLDHGGVSVQTINEDLTVSGSVTIPNNTAGWGLLNAGENIEYAKFVWNVDRTVTIIMSSDNVANTDTASTISIYNNGSNVTIKNNLASTITIQAQLCYSEITSEL